MARRRARAPREVAGGALPFRLHDLGSWAPSVEEELPCDVLTPWSTCSLTGRDHDEWCFVFAGRRVLRAARLERA